MRRYFYFSLLTLLVLFAGCTQSVQTSHELIYQTSTIDALLNGVYDGDISLADLSQHGDFGIGTFNALDGEMLLLDGTFYQIAADGHVYVKPDSVLTPFATVTHFDIDTTLTFNSPVDFAAFTAAIDSLVPSLNRFYAIQVHGTFSAIKTRSVPRQTEPYPPLAEVAKTQPEFEYTQTTGTLAGFRCPAFVKGINVPGYHLHFLSDDHQTGGHVLEFTLAQGTVQLDETTDFQLRLPEGAAFEQTDLTNDQTAALEKVEK